MWRLNTSDSERDQTSVKTTLRQVQPKKATQAHAIKAPTEIFIPEVVQYPEGFVVELSDGDYKLERAPDAVGGYCILRYTPGPPGYVSIVVVKRVGADDPPGRSCCAHSPDEALLPSKPSSETLIDAGN